MNEPKTILYGIPQCGSIRKAKSWLEENKIAFTFHNFKKEGLEAEKLQQWIDKVGWEILLNKRGTTWRNLEPAQKEDLDQKKAFQLLLENTSMIKRPVLEIAGKSEILVGFDEEKYQEIFS